MIRDNSAFNVFIVYDNLINKQVLIGAWAEVKDYADREGRYTVVSCANGMIMN